MRLLQSITLELKEFSSKRIPPYAILSHTWGEDEVSFQDMQGCNAGKRAGYDKIKQSCFVAATEGFEYVWLDTCCIDKSSSSELSEAINSMYQWYQDAEVCYVYLSDVSSRGDPRDPGSSFAKSRWFTRGWTLQELIAPSTVIFFASDWQEIGTKSSLQGIISDITCIQINILSGDDLESVSVAQRMSWASKRETTRTEDLAYCLMGIFGVNMPMLYGEGERAFIRLQEEIMKVSDDHTIFAWKLNGILDPDYDGGLLASSPAAFINSGNIIRSGHASNSAPFTVTNKGLHLELPLIALDHRKTYLAVLNCQEIDKCDQLLGIWLRDISETGEYFVRDWIDNIRVVDSKERAGLHLKSVYVRQGRRPARQRDTASYSQCFIRTVGVQMHGFSLCEIYPRDPWMQPDGKVTNMTPVYDDIFGALKFEDSHGCDFVVVLKKKERLLCANVVTNFGSETLKEIFWSFNAVPKSKQPKREWKNEPDRIFRQQLSGDWICVAIRRQMISGQKHLVVDISRIKAAQPAANQKE